MATKSEAAVPAVTNGAALAARTEIEKLELELAVDAPAGGDVPDLPPKLELVSDKARKKGEFVLGTKNGEKMVLGGDVRVVYIHEGVEARTLMSDDDERPRCAAIDGVPQASIEHPKASSCFGCVYDTWEGGERYRDEDGLRCRVKRQAVVSVVIYEGGVPVAVLPALLIVPPASLGAERAYKSDLKAMGRLRGRGALRTAFTVLEWEWTAKGKFEFAKLKFRSDGLASEALPPELWLTHLQDAKAIRDGIASGRLKQEAHDDVRTQREADEDGSKAGDDEQLPF